MITTQELARLAGVSQSTVSRSLNNSPSISEETRARVQELARQQGYVVKQRRPAARKGGGKGGIGIILNARVLHKSLDLYLEYLSNDIIGHIERAGYYTVLLTDNAGPEFLARVTSILKSGTVQGFVIINANHNPALEQTLNDYDIPHVYTQYFSRPLQKNMNIVDVDHFTGGLLAAEHLIALGHRRIATFTCRGSDFEDRTAGYRTALEQGGLPFDPALVVSTDVTYRSGQEAIGANWQRLKDCTAFFAQTDIVGIAALNYLQDHGHSVPSRYSVIGFDGIEEGAYCRPQLTTVVQPIAEIGELTIRRLIRLIDREDTKATHSFTQPLLLVRQSTASPAEK